MNMDKKEWMYVALKNSILYLHFLSQRLQCHYHMCWYVSVYSDNNANIAYLHEGMTHGGIV